MAASGAQRPMGMADRERSLADGKQLGSTREQDNVQPKRTLSWRQKCMALQAVSKLLVPRINAPLHFGSRGEASS